MRFGVRGVVSLVAPLLVACPGPPPPPEIPACGPDTLATTPPLDMLDLAAVGPMGAVNPERTLVYPSHALSFFVRPVDPRLPEGEVARVPVVAPGRIWLERVRRSFFSGSPDEFSVTFRTCTDVTWTVDHMVNASPQVRAIADDPGHTCGSGRVVADETSFCEGTTPGLELAAGTELGLAGSSVNRSIAVSTRNLHATPVMYATGRQERFVCPLESFDPAAADALRPLLGTPDGRRRTAEPLCGVYMQDAVGTAQGGWAGSADGTRLALVHDNVDPGVALISISIPFMDSHLWRFAPTHAGNVNRDFREVTSDGTIYCYDASSGGDLPSIVLVQVEGAGLRFERQDATACGAGPWTFNFSFSNQFFPSGP